MRSCIAQTSWSAAVLDGEQAAADPGAARWLGRTAALLAHPFALVALHVVALWPVWRWYANRVTDGSDEPWGVLALFAVLLLVWRRRGSLRQTPSAGLLVAAGVLTLLSALTGPGFALALPALVRACIGVSALALTLAAVLDRSRPLLPLWVLLLLALPVVSSLQFYLGYPLRAFTAWASADALSAIGLPVAAAGASLHWQGRTVLVDAPCSGVHMLWVGMFLTALLSYLQRAEAMRFGANLAAAFAIVVSGNVLRNALLFVKEVQMIHLPDWAHAATGVGVFFATAATIAGLVRGRPHASR